MKPRIKQPEQPASRPFWAVHVRSKSGIAHLVTAESTIFLGRETSDTPFFYVSECGRRYAFWEIKTIGVGGISAPRCKRCMASKYATWRDERRAAGSKITNRAGWLRFPASSTTVLTVMTMNCANLLENLGYACAPRANGALRVWSPFTFDDGEHLAVFIEPAGNGQWLVTDHADVLMHASAHGASITKSKLDRIRNRFQKVAITESGRLSAVASDDSLSDTITNVLNTAIAISHLESSLK